MLNCKKCKDCYYGSICPSAEACEDFTPITEEAEDEAIEEIIERGREEFRTDWNTYISANQE